MLNSGGKNFELCVTKKNILTLVLFGKQILNETKNHNPPPFKLNGRSLTHAYIYKSQKHKLWISIHLNIKLAAHKIKTKHKH